MEENEEIANDSNQNEILLDSCPVTGLNSLVSSIFAHMGLFFMQLYFSHTGEIKIGQKLAEVKDRDSWEAAVTEHRVGRNVVASEQRSYLSQASQAALV